MAQSPEYPDLRWIPPRSFTSGRPSGQPTKITVHYTAGAERSTSAEDGAAYDQRRTDGTSSHYYVDSDSVVQCVRTTDRSHTALYHGNREGIHYELCGTVQTRAQWLDGASRATIRNAARQMARDMRRYGIPLARLSGRQVRAAAVKGICGHVDWTNGWPEDGGTHTDPGPQFPWDVLFDDIQGFLTGTEEDEMSLAEDDITIPPASGRLSGAQQTGRADQYLGYAIRRQDEDAIALTAKLDALLAAAGSEVQRDAAERARQLAADAADAARDAQLLAEVGQVEELVSAIPGSDPEALADAIAARLRVTLPADTVAMLAAKLAG